MCFILPWFLHRVFYFYQHLLWCFILVCLTLVYFYHRVKIVVPILIRVLVQKNHKSDLRHHVSVFSHIKNYAETTTLTSDSWIHCGYNHCFPNLVFWEKHSILSLSALYEYPNNRPVNLYQGLFYSILVGSQFLIWKRAWPTMDMDIYVPRTILNLLLLILTLESIMCTIIASRILS